MRDLETREWTEEMYVFCDDMFSDLVGIFGEDNVRVISAEEHARHCLRRRQDREVASCREADATSEPTNSAPKTNNVEAIGETDASANVEAAPIAPPKPPPAKKEGPLTPAELREKRVQYFERQQWKRRLRPRK